MDKNKLIIEEQKILNDFVICIDECIKIAKGNKQSTHLNDILLTPESYGAILTAAYKAKILNADIRGLVNGRDALYEYRMDMSYISSDGNEGEDKIKVTRMTSLDDDSTVLWNPNTNDPLMVTWLNKIVRPFILDQERTDYKVSAKNEWGELISTEYRLNLKRKVDIRFEKVKNVEHLFPLTAKEAEETLGDIFLSELAKKRSDKEFTDIIFTIQKKQGEIIRQSFEQNIIVQGCAGSGKSMIMLHRLPVLLYDHAVQKSNVYIISPSQSYIQLVNNMRKQLQIYDIAMGTLEQYYETAVGRYRIVKNIYKTISGEALPYQMERYLYSDYAIKDITDYISEKIETIPYDIDNLFPIFGEIPKSINTEKPSENISGRIINLSKIIRLNGNVINNMFSAIKEYLDKVKILNFVLSNRVQQIIVKINKAKADKELIIEQNKSSIENLDAERHSKSIDKIKEIEDANNAIIQMDKEIEYLQNDENYHDLIANLYDLTELQLLIFKALNDIRENNDLKTLYGMFKKYKLLQAACSQMVTEDYKCEERYNSYVQPLSQNVNELAVLMERIIQADKSKVEYHTMKVINSSLADLQALSKSIINDTYYYILEKSGYVFDDKNREIGITASPYIFLRILYQYYGKPNSSGENLIAIDEAQNMAPNEFKLIKAINAKVVFNVFGDVNQHIENSKGLDSWNDISELCNFANFELNENYRNASQITKFCNKKFFMNMTAINLDGKGVSEYTDFDNFIAQVKIRQKNCSNEGLSAIIVNDASEARDIKEKLSSEFLTMQNTINDLTENSVEIYNDKWNLMTVDSAKGLEFNCVIAVISNMTENEKYIACTRALDELIVYSGKYEVTNDINSNNKQIFIDKDSNQIKSREITSKESEIINISTETLINPSSNASKPQKSVTEWLLGRFNQRFPINTKKAEEESTSSKKHDVSKETIEFFAKSGLKIIDERDTGGEFWIIGDKVKTNEIIKLARRKFKISSIQYGERSPGVYGWHTKARHL